MTTVAAIESFYCNLLILINTCIVIEIISFLMGEVKMAFIFRSMVFVITSIPVINHFVIPNSPFEYCYNHASMNRLLYYLLIEDSLIFVFIRQCSYLLYHLFFVCLPLFALFYCINKETVHSTLQRVVSFNNNQNSIV